MADLNEGAGEEGLRLEEGRRKREWEGVTALEMERLEAERLDCSEGVDERLSVEVLATEGERGVIFLGVVLV
jgi:hypothetical protein